LDAGRRDVAAPRPRIQGYPDRPAATARRRDARGPAFLRARDRASRGTPPRRPCGGARVSTQPVAVTPLERGGVTSMVGRRAADWLPAARGRFGGLPPSERPVTQ